MLKHKKSIFAIVGTTVALLTIVALAFGSNGGWDVYDPEPKETQWLAEKSGGSYKINNETLTLTSPPRGYITLSKKLNYSSDFTISYEVKAVELGFLALKVGDDVSFGSTGSICFEVSHDYGEAKGFEIARLVEGYPLYNGWAWGAFAPAEQGVWYRLEIQIKEEPFEAVYRVYKDGMLYGMARCSDMSLSFRDLQYVGFEVNEASEYKVRFYEESG
jgi:hypothetical protein